MTLQLKKIDELCDAKDYKGAIKLCDQLLTEEHNTEFTAEVLRERASIFNCLGELENALKDYQTVLHLVENPKVADYFFLGSYSVRLRKYKEAINFLNDGIILTCDRQETYYFHSLLFVKAYALYKVGALDLAGEALKDIKPDFKLWVDNPRKPLSKNKLLQLIENKNKSLEGHGA